MRRGIAFTVLLVVALAVIVSCSRVPYLYILNNTGQTLEVVRAAVRGKPDAELKGRTWSWPWIWRFLIERGQGREITWSFGEDWIVEIDALDCRVRYEIPSGEYYYDEAWREFPRSDGPPFVKVQIEPDLMLYAVHEGAERTYDISYFADIQPTGFPLQPVARVCSPQT